MYVKYFILKKYNYCAGVVQSANELSVGSKMFVL